MRRYHYYIYVAPGEIRCFRIDRTTREVIQVAIIQKEARKKGKGATSGLYPISYAAFKANYLDIKRTVKRCSREDFVRLMKKVLTDLNVMVTLLREMHK